MEASNESEPEENRNNINFVVKSLEPALFVENVFGIYRFRYVRGQLLPTNTLMKFGAIFISCTVVGLFSGFLRLPSAWNGCTNEELIGILQEAPSIVMLTQFAITVITTSFFFSNSNIKICSMFSELDNMLHVNMDKNFYKKLKNQTYKYLFILIVSQMFFSVVDLATDDDITVSQFIVIPLYLERDLEVMFFCKLIVMLEYRLQIIKRHLSKKISIKDLNRTVMFVLTRDSKHDNDFCWIGRTSSENMRIKDLAVMYDMIGEICLLTNNVFNFQIFMTLVSCFTYIVIAIWGSLYYFRTSNMVSENILTIITWCIAEVCAIGVMSLVCEKLLSQRNECKVLANELVMDYDLPRSMRIQAKALMELIESWPLRITVYHMFTVDITLMLKFISVATTYLIVIIQISHFA